MLIQQSFDGAQNSRAATRDVSIRDGWIQTGEAGLRELRRKVAETLNISQEQVQISIIRKSGRFDNGPQTQLSYNFD